MHFLGLFGFAFWVTINGVLYFFLQKSVFSRVFHFQRPFGGCLFMSIYILTIFQVSCGVRFNFLASFVSRYLYV